MNADRVGRFRLPVCICVHPRFPLAIGGDALRPAQDAAVVSPSNGGDALHPPMIELAITAVSFEITVLIHEQARVNHFQTWMLSSLEWRLDQIMKELKARKE